MQTETKNLIATIDGWEYWKFEDQVYRNSAGDRGYMTAEGYPSNIRWECSIEHFNRYLAPKSEEATAKRLARNKRARENRRAMNTALDSIGMKRVRGAMGGTYYE